MNRRLALGAIVAILATSGALAAEAVPGGSPAPTAAPLIRILDQPIAVAADGDFGVLLSIDGAPEATEIAVDIYGRARPGELLGVEPAEDPVATFPVVALPRWSTTGPGRRGSRSRSTAPTSRPATRRGATRSPSPACTPCGCGCATRAATSPR